MRNTTPLLLSSSPDSPSDSCRRISARDSLLPSVMPIRLLFPVSALPLSTIMFIGPRAQEQFYLTQRAASPISLVVFIYCSLTIILVFSFLQPFTLVNAAVSTCCSFFAIHTVLQIHLRLPWLLDILLREWWRMNWRGWRAGWGFGCGWYDYKTNDYGDDNNIFVCTFLNESLFSLSLSLFSFLSLRAIYS